jgi:hypothetical protein
MNKNIQSDPFWYNDIGILIHPDRLTEFFPVSSYTLEEKFNALVRLSLYISIILFYYNADYNYISIFLATLLITYFVWINRPLEKESSEIKEPSQPKTQLVEKLENESLSSCTRPTLDNPFMNVTMKDLLNSDENQIVDRPPACDITDPEVKKEIDDHFNNNLFRDVNDIFGKMNSQRQFYTMPSTTIPNAQDEFAKWLYLNPKTCKEDQDYCVAYEDLRAKRPVFYDPTQNPVETKK